METSLLVPRNPVVEILDALCALRGTSDPVATVRVRLGTGDKKGAVLDAAMGNRKAWFRSTYSVLRFNKVPAGEGCASLGKITPLPGVPLAKVPLPEDEVLASAVFGTASLGMLAVVPAPVPAPVSAPVLVTPVAPVAPVAVPAAVSAGPAALSVVPDCPGPVAVAVAVAVPAPAPAPVPAPAPAPAVPVSVAPVGLVPPVPVAAVPAAAPLPRTSVESREALCTAFMDAVCTMVPCTPAELTSVKGRALSAAFQQLQAAASVHDNRFSPVCSLCADTDLTCACGSSRDRPHAAFPAYGHVAEWVHWTRETAAVAAVLHHTLTLGAQGALPLGVANPVLSAVAAALQPLADAYASRVPPTAPDHPAVPACGAVMTAWRHLLGAGQTPAEWQSLVPLFRFKGCCHAGVPPEAFLNAVNRLLPAEKRDAVRVYTANWAKALGRKAKAALTWAVKSRKWNMQSTKVQPSAEKLQPEVDPMTGLFRGHKLWSTNVKMPECVPYVVAVGDFVCTGDEATVRCLRHGCRTIVHWRTACRDQTICDREVSEYYKGLARVCTGWLGSDSVFVHDVLSR